MKAWLALASFLLAACGPILMLGEKAAADCSGSSFEELERESFRLVRRQQGVERGVPLRLRVYRDCRIDPGGDLSRLGIKALHFENPTSRVPDLVIELGEPDAEGNQPVCTAAFELGRALVFACPEGYYFELLPEP